MMKINTDQNILDCLGSFRLGVIQADVICTETTGELQEFMQNTVSEGYRTDTTWIIAEVFY